MFDLEVNGGYYINTFKPQPLPDIQIFFVYNVVFDLQRKKDSSHVMLESRNFLKFSVHRVYVKCFHSDGFCAINRNNGA